MTAFAPLAWSVPSFLPAGLLLLTGAPKSGKSWLALGCAYACASGGVALGRFQCEAPAPVLYFGLEDSDRRMKARLEIVAGAPPWPAIFEYATSTEGLMLGQGFEPMLEGLLKSRPGSKLVVIDTLGCIKPPSGRDVYSSDVAALRGLQTLAARYGCTILLVHHSRKPSKEGGKDPVAEASGTFGLTGTVDGVLSLTRNRGGSEGLLTCSMRDCADSTWDMTFDAGVWTAAPRIGEVAGSTQAKVAALLRDDVPRTVREIADELDLGTDAVRMAVSRGVKGGSLGRNAEGRVFRVLFAEASI